MPEHASLPPVDQAVEMGERPWLWWAQHDEAGRLAGMALPTADFDFGRFAALGLEAVVSLVGPQAYDPAPLAAHTFRLHDLSFGGLPPSPEQELVEINAAVAKINGLLDAGTGVVVHCHAGIGRTGTVIGSVLTSRGHRTEDVVAYLDAVQRRRGARGWPESAWQKGVLASFAG